MLNNEILRKMAKCWFRLVRVRYAIFISHGVRQGQDTVFPDKHRNRVILRMNRMLPAALKDHTIPEIMPFSPGQMQKQRRLSRSRLLSEKRDSLLPVCVSGLLYNLHEANPILKNPEI